MTSLQNSMIKSHDVICIESVEELRGQRVKLVTHDGLYRHGLLTSFRTTTTTIYGVPHHFPEWLILNGEETDPIPWEQIKSIDLEDEDR